MSACCAPNGKQKAGACPKCGGKLKAVQQLTLKHLVCEGEKEKLLDEGYGFCPAPHCDVVYVSQSARHAVLKSRLKVRVGIKETQDPIPLCYCFGFNRADLFKEVEETGDTEIPAFIREKVRVGACFCERSNPSGTCCLGDIGRAVKEAKERVSVVSRKGKIL